MLSKNPVVLDKLQSVDSNILRLAIISELDAVSLYEQMADTTKSEGLKKLLLDIAKEEKTHVGEFQSLLLSIDKEQEKELKEGDKEAKKITKSDKENVMAEDLKKAEGKGDIEEALAIIDDDSTNPEGAELSDKEKAELKAVITKAFEEA